MAVGKHLVITNAYSVVDWVYSASHFWINMTLGLNKSAGEVINLCDSEYNLIYNIITNKFYWTLFIVIT